MLSSGRELALPLANTFARTVDAIDWDQVSSEVHADWRAWRSGTEMTEENRALVEVVDRKLIGVAPDLPSEAGILRAAYLADNGLPEGADSDVLSSAADDIVSALDRERKAAPGVVHFGGPASSNVAAAFALRFGMLEVWEALVAHLCDPNVHSVSKSLALDRIAAQINEVPVDVRMAIKEGFAGVEGSVRSDSFGSPSPLKFFAEAIRVGVTVGSISRERALSMILQLAASGVRDRMEAAKTIPFATKSGDPTWGHALLLQLSHDSEPFVRAEAGRSLVMSIRADSDLTDAVYDRIIELAGSDGLRVPLSVLHGLQATAESDAASVGRLLPTVQNLAGSGANTIVKAAADIVLRLVNGGAS